MANSAKSKKYAIIGAGVSGLSVARMLVEKGQEAIIFEKEATPGGLIRCEIVEGILYHCVGGHVFNSRNQSVLNWFWQHFPKNDFTLAHRNAIVALEDGTTVNYPIENHLYQMPETMRNNILDDLLHISANGYPKDDNFDDFLLHRFGETLYTQYFSPYNHKIWRRELKDIPLSWLNGKLPMPTVKEILSANISQEKEMKMVHSTFHYPNKNGSQYIADTLAQGLDIRYQSAATSISRIGNQWEINGEYFDTVIFCANVKTLPDILRNINIDFQELNTLEAHGTTSVLCEICSNPYSWIYMPSTKHESHRIICTGNFASSNAPAGISTATIEFTLPLSIDEIKLQLKHIPFSPRYITHRYTPYTYPVQTNNTAAIIGKVKQQLAPYNFYLLGRFAEWEYYNMDAAMEAAMKLTSRLCQ